jgi:hypothetical protein
MTPDALDLMQREKLTKMVMKDYFLEINSKDSILRINPESVVQEFSVLEDAIFNQILDELLKDFLI